MSSSSWCLPDKPLDDETLLQTIGEVHESAYQSQFLRDPMANHAMGIQMRALRRVEDWRVLLILTPWMLARLLLPDRPPAIPVPDEWSAESRKDADYLLLGPGVTLQLMGQDHKAHLNYEPRLGHYLIQPLILNMSDFDSPDDAFEAWNQVIETRDRNMETLKRHCPWQKEVSRREFFRRLKNN